MWVLCKAKAMGIGPGASSLLPAPVDGCAPNFGGSFALPQQDQTSFNRSKILLCLRSRPPLIVITAKIHLVNIMLLPLSFNAIFFSFSGHKALKNSWARALGRFSP